MPTITIKVPRITEGPNGDYVNGLAYGDKLYYCSVTSTAGFSVSNSFTEIGTVTFVNHTTSLDDGTLTTEITCEIDNSTPVPTTSDFIFFSKDNQVNLTSLLGYFASTKFVNNSTAKAELFSVGCEIAESSK